MINVIPERAQYEYTLTFGKDAEEKSSYESFNVIFDESNSNNDSPQKKALCRIFSSSNTNNQNKKQYAILFPIDLSKEKVDISLPNVLLPVLEFLDYKNHKIQPDVGFPINQLDADILIPFAIGNNCVATLYIKPNYKSDPSIILYANEDFFKTKYSDQIKTMISNIICNSVYVNFPLNEKGPNGELNRGIITDFARNLIQNSSTINTSNQIENKEAIPEYININKVIGLFPKQYNAPKPVKNIGQIISKWLDLFVTGILLTPVILLILPILLGLLCFISLSKLNILLMESYKKFLPFTCSFLFKKLNDGNNSLHNNVRKNFINVKTADGVRMHVVEFVPPSFDDKTPPEKKKYSFEFLGNYGKYEKMYCIFEEAAIKTNRIVVPLNYLTLNEEPKSPVKLDAYVNNGIANVQRLLDKGVLAENIMLHGHSLGGAIATLVAKYFHDQKKKVYLFNDRSFSSVTNLFTAGIGVKNPTLRSICKTFIKFMLNLFGLELEAGNAYMKLPQDHKDYISAPRDEIIPYDYASIETQLAANRQQLPGRKVDLSTAIASCYSNYQSSHPGEVLTPIHNEPIDNLQTSEGENAATIFERLLGKSSDTSPGDSKNQIVSTNSSTN